MHNSLHMIRLLINYSGNSLVYWRLDERNHAPSKQNWAEGNGRSLTCRGYLKLDGDQVWLHTVWPEKYKIRQWWGCPCSLEYQRWSKKKSYTVVLGWNEIMTGSADPTFICFEKKRINHFQYTTEVYVHYIQSLNMIIWLEQNVQSCMPQIPKQSSCCILGMSLNNKTTSKISLRRQESELYCPWRIIIQYNCINKTFDWWRYRLPVSKYRKMCQFHALWNITYQLVKCPRDEEQNRRNNSFH